MKNPFRRRPKLAESMPQTRYTFPELIGATPTLLAPLMPPRPALDPDVQASIDRELEKHPVAMAERGCFFGVPMSHFNREELMQIVSWVAYNARDPRRDS